MFFLLVLMILQWLAPNTAILMTSLLLVENIIIGLNDAIYVVRFNILVLDDESSIRKRLEGTKLWFHLATSFFSIHHQSLELLLLMKPFLLYLPTKILSRSN